ncbi:terminase small subunit [Aminobacter sp. UC22_36]|uniref:terminase small subunit n=1 Tax=Aminobacter sp. UC22_36 TaxID=3374549 RepID=UPI0037562F40
MSDLTAKQEAFALAYVETGNGSEAYRRAYEVRADTKPETIWSEASRLLANPTVAARVKELQQQARDLAMVSIGTLTGELELARVKAMGDEKGASAAVSAIMGKAKLHGLLVEKAEVTGKGGAPLTSTVDDLSKNDIARRVAFLLAQGLNSAAK